MTITTKSISTRIGGKRIGPARRAATAAAAGAILAAGATALAGPAAAGGWSPVQSCTSLTGVSYYQPGLTSATRAQSVLLSGSLAGCTNVLTGAAEPGSGLLSANLSGASSTAAVALGGAFTINWPSSSGLNPSNGTLSVSGPVQGVYNVSGRVTSGAYTGSVVRTSLRVTGVNADADGTASHAVTQQSFTNTTPLQALRNFW